MIGFVNLLPHSYALSAFVREKDSAFLILAPLHHDFNFIAGLELDIAFSVSDFGNGNQSFGFKANIYNDVG